MRDIFEQKILCNRCNVVMKPIEIFKNGFRMRALHCDKCGEKIVHPADLQEYQQFSNLKSKIFRVKLRVVGNSYTVSIPKEIVSFMQEQEKIMNDMVSLCFEEAGKLSLMFHDMHGNMADDFNKRISEHINRHINKN